MTTPIEEGAMVRLTRTVDDLKVVPGHSRHRKGETFIVEEFLTAGDPAKDEIDVDFYYGNTQGGYNNVCVPADAVELVLTARQVRDRKPPSLVTLTDLVASECLTDSDAMSLDSSERFPDGRVEFYGRTVEGLSFMFEVQVTRIAVVDD